MTPAEHSLFTAVLGLRPPWEVVSVMDFDPEAKRIDLEVGFARGARFGCPACGAVDQPVHDTRRRSWQHLHFFEHVQEPSGSNTGSRSA